MNFSKFNYPTIVSAIAAVAVLIIGAFEHTRVAPELRTIFLIVRSAYGLSALFFMFYFYKNEISDASASIFSGIMLSYFLCMMWFLPMYEISYIQCGIGVAFLRFKRNWIFPLMYFIAWIAIFFNYHLQESFNWTLPPVAKSDWFFTTFIFFLLGWGIQKFAISAANNERDRLIRFSVIGKETTRLTHDLKGLLSSPLMIIEAFRSKDMNFPPDFYEKQMSLLIGDMDNVREAIKSLNRLAVIEESVQVLNIADVIKGSMRVLERRLSGIKVVLPEGRLIESNPARLHSVFFNLILNSIEAFERNKTQEDKCIEIFWEGTTLHIRDNAGGLSTDNVARTSLKGLGSGLGLELVMNDLKKVNALFKISSTVPFTTVEIKFL